MEKQLQMDKENPRQETKEKQCESEGLRNILRETER